MADLVVIVPSRGRPKAAHELVDAFRETCVANTLPTFAVDADDPTIGEYPYSMTLPVDEPSTMVAALNFAATGVAKLWEPTAIQRGYTLEAPFAIGFMGDDHRPRTQGWDKEYLDALRELGSGIVYGNDLLQGENLPTQCAMTADIVRALGYMAPPELRHLFVDNFWRDLGSEADRLFYLPDVVVEHMHPFAGKAEMDAGYERVNDQSMYERDAAAYEAYRRERFAADVAKVAAR